MAPFVTLALAQFQPRKGDYSGNLERIGALLAQASSLEPRPSPYCGKVRIVRARSGWQWQVSWRSRGWSSFRPYPAR